MRFRTASTLLAAGLFTITLAGCTATTEEPEVPKRDLSGQISITTQDKDEVLVSYKSVTAATADEIKKLQSLNPDVSGFTDYETFFVRMTVDTNSTDTEVVAGAVGNILAIDANDLETGAIPNTKGSACDGTQLTPDDGALTSTFCKVVLAEPGADPAGVGITKSIGDEIFTTVPVKGATATPTPTETPSASETPAIKED